MRQKSSRTDTRLRYPSYHEPLAEALALTQSRQRKPLLRGIEKLKGLCEDYPHIVAVEQALALAYVELASLPDRESASERDAHLAQAESILNRLREEQALSDQETLGRLGRVMKERAWDAPPLGENEDSPRKLFYENALKFYSEAYRLQGHYYPGINVATLNFLLHREKAAQAVAREVLQACRSAQAEDDVERTWIFATEGEAHLLLGDYEEAAESFHLAMKLAPSPAQADSPRRHVRHILAEIPPEDEKERARQELVREALGMGRG